MKAAGVLVVILNAREAWAGTITGKVFEYLAIRRPIVFIGPRGAASSLIEEAGAGVVADPEDGPAMEAAIEQAAVLARDPSFEGATDSLLTRFDRRAQATTWSELLERVMSRPGGCTVRAGTTR
jgi:hypothetical protein